jgi:hypothetical protein
MQKLQRYGFLFSIGGKWAPTLKNLIGILVVGKYFKSKLLIKAMKDILNM